MTRKADLQQINKELTALYEFCRKNNLNEEELASICRPLRRAVTKIKIKRIVFRTVILSVLLASACYLATTDTVSWHLSAIGRMALIKILPIWNWQHLKDQKCLVSINSDLPKSPHFECALCEALARIDVTNTDVNPTYLKQHYIDLHTPIIITEALHNWTEIDLQKDRIFTESLPCKLSSNIHNGQATSSARLISKLDDFDQYFVHFQNCVFDAVKAFRLFTPKPSFLPAELSPVQYNWLLMSRNYNYDYFKHVDLTETIALFGQTRGSNYIRLLPRLNCRDACPIVEMELFQGEALILTSMWDLEYKPNVVLEENNVAVILEMH